MACVVPWTRAGAQPQSEGTAPSPTRHTSDWLPNAWWVHASVLSGGMPHGPEAFAELSKLGVRTIISVDGIPPEVGLATQHGLRYVHLPHGYDGISDARILEIAKAVRELPKPVYLHCHHGKHRSPTAAAAACVALGWIPEASGEAFLKTAGTNPAYRGLWDSVRRTQAVASSVFEGLTVEFVPIAKLPPMVETMVAMDASLDRLKALRGNHWASEGIDGPLEALMLQDHYTELHRSELREERDARFLQLLLEGAALATGIETNLMAIKKSRSSSRDLEDALKTSMERLERNCVDCHTRFRDVSPMPRP
jgi:hypothetical protein